MSTQGRVANAHARAQLTINQSADHLANGLVTLQCSCTCESILDWIARYEHKAYANVIPLCFLVWKRRIEGVDEDFPNAPEDGGCYSVQDACGLPGRWERSGGHSSVARLCFWSLLVSMQGSATAIATPCSVNHDSVDLRTV